MSIRVAGAAKTLEANGAATANINVAAADDATYSVAADGANYAHVEFMLSCAFAVAPGESSSVDLWLRPLDIDAANDAEIPENSNAFKGTWYAGSFLVNNVTPTQYAMIRTFDVPPNFTAYIHNNTGQTMSAGWMLKATPVAYKAAP